MTEQVVRLALIVALFVLAFVLPSSCATIEPETCITVCNARVRHYTALTCACK